MMLAHLTFEADSEVSEILKTRLEKVTNEEIRSIRRRNADGALPTILTTLQVTSPLIGVMLPLLVDMLRPKRFKRIKLVLPNGTEIEFHNPTEAEWRELCARVGVEPPR